MKDNTRRNRIVHGSLFFGLFYLSGPMLISGLLQNLQSLIDLFWVGRLGSESVAAISLSGTVMMLMFPVIMGLASGVVAVVSRSVGAGFYDKASVAAAQALLTGLALGLLSGAMGYVFARPLLVLLGGDPVVVQIGSGYLGILFLGIVSVYMFFMTSSVLQAAGNTMAPMFSMLIANVLNMALDPVLIFGLFGFPKMGVRGAALATVISQTLAMSFICGLLFFRKVKVFRIRFAHFRPRPDVLLLLTKIGLPSSGQLLARSLMTLVLMRVVAGFGTAAVAAYGIGMRFHMLALMPAFALGGATATMVGQNLGAGSPGRATRAAWLAASVCALIMVSVAFVLVPFAPRIISVFTDNVDVIGIGVSYLRIVTPFYLFVAFAIVFGRAVAGAGDTVTPMLTTFVALWLFQVPLAVFLPRVMSTPTNGVWVAIGAAVTVHGIMNTAWFLRGKWRHKKI